MEIPIIKRRIVLTLNREWYPDLCSNLEFVGSRIEV